MIDGEQITKDTFVADVECFESLSSTNDHALQRSAEATCKKPLLVIAEQQTAGRGRGGNSWWSSTGALTFSLLYQTVTSDPPPYISLAAGVAVCEAVRDLAPDINVGLKWPNDIYIGERKLAGLLIERPSHSRRDVVLGIGLNVNNTFTDAPADIQQRAISLVDAAGQTFDSQLVLTKLLQHLEVAIAAIDSDPQWLPSKWQELCILRGRHVVIEAGGQQYAGICQGIDDTGAIVIDTPAGQKNLISGVVHSFL